MPRMSKITAVGDKRPMCGQIIHVPAAATRTQEHRVWRARRSGRDANQCPTRASYLLDGEPLCPMHAGRRAIDVLMEEPNARD